jgi:hypothetical protein
MERSLTRGAPKASDDAVRYVYVVTTNGETGQGHDPEAGADRASTCCACMSGCHLDSILFVMEGEGSMFQDLTALPG